MRPILKNNRVFRGHSLLELIRWAGKRLAGRSTARFRMLPDFIIIGAQRSGTTSLFNYLNQHPEIHPSFPKEIHYFSNHYHKGSNWYRSHFPLTINKKINVSYRKQNFITGEATPYYLNHPLAAERVFKLVPNVKLIVLLRNPVDRAYSHYQHQVKMGTENLPFDEAIDAEETRISGEVERIKQEKEYRSFNLQNYSYLSRGIYIYQLREWLEYFDRNQMLVMESERLFRNPSHVLKEIYDFLGVSDYELSIYKNYHHAQYQPMDPFLRQKLSDYFSPNNRKLFEYLDVNPFWNDS